MADEIVREFLVESTENLDLLDRELVTLEKDPKNKETLSSIFRTIHTIKGTCGFLGFDKLEKVAHAGENLLSQMRDGALDLNPERTTALLSLVDAIRHMLDSIGVQGNEGERNDQVLIATLDRLQNKAAAPQKHPTPKPWEAKKETVSDAGAPAASKPIGQILVDSGKATAEEVAGAIRKQLEGDTRTVGEILIQLGIVQAQEVQAVVQAQQNARNSIADASIRVDVALLDRLMNLVGELVLARNQISQHAGAAQDSGFSASSQRLNLITTELQEGVMKTRMQPIGNIWSKFPRTVRDVAVNCGKEVRIEMEGKETELDKTIIESIKDPLMHLVRNSVDHGIEKVELRVAAGKAAEGLLRLRAYHEGGQVNIEITDDGAGLNGEKIKKKALERGLITAEQAARLTERETANLIFLPGFSTADAVTNVSGRGVGMDVVKTNIERIGGTVEVQTKLGAGTTVKMKIPLTLAIIPALMVSCEQERFAIPQVSLLELLQVETRDATKKVEWVQGVPVYRLRGQLLPLVYLNSALCLEAVKKESQAGVDEQQEREAGSNIVVLQAEGRRFGLVVDRVHETEEIVVKPLGKQLKCVRVFAGATIRGDGKVALILDVRRLAQAAGLIDEGQASGRKTAEKEEPCGKESEGRQTLLIFQSGKSHRMAIDLSLVARLEEIPQEAVENAGGCEVVQYRGQILPLVRVADVVGRGRKRKKEEETGGQKLQVVVFTEGGRSVGLIVDQILDIVEENLVVEPAQKKQGLLGSAVIQKRVTEVLDAREVVRMAWTELGMEEELEVLAHG